MWTKEVPKKPGYYWAIVREGLSVVVPMVVGEMSAGQLGCFATGENIINVNDAPVIYWAGPIDAPIITDEMKEEVGELMEMM